MKEGSRTAPATARAKPATPRAPSATARTAPAAPPAPNAAAPARPVALQRVSKGKRPRFHDSEAVDQLFALVTALTAELSVAFDRIDTLERVLVAAGVITEDRVETYQPSGRVTAARSAKREALIERVFAVFETYAAPQPAATSRGRRVGKPRR